MIDNALQQSAFRHDTIALVGADRMRHEQLEAGLRRKDAERNTLLDNIPGIIARYDQHLRHVFVNAAAVEMHGLPAASVIGKTHRELGWPARSCQIWENALGCVFATGGPTDIDFERIGPAGARRFAARLLPERSALGTVDSVVAIVREVIDQARDAQNLETLGRLVAGVAHDFNNLTTTMLGYAHLLEDTLDLSDRRRADVAEIYTAAERAADLARQILAFCRKQPDPAAILDVNAVVAGITTLLHRVIGEQIELTIACDPAAGRVGGQVRQLEQVIVNLVINARDSMRDGGRLSIETASFVADDSFRSMHPGVRRRRYVALTVTDTGTGMDEEIRSRLFEPFFTTREQDGGTGLGLALVHGIVRRAGGHVLVDSTPGRGTRFTVLLPAIEEEPAPAAMEVPLREGPDAGGTVLLVEDDLQLRQVLAGLLRRRGYKVIEAADGQEALAMGSGSAPMYDLLITDMIMPRLGGKALANALRERLPTLKVIYMSGYPGTRDVRAPHLGFLRKPFSPNRLMSEVRRLLDSEAPGGGAVPEPGTPSLSSTESERPNSGASAAG